MNTTEFSDSIAKVQPDLIAFGASIDDISKASAAVANNFGVLTTETADIVSESVKIGAAFGVQADTMVNVVSEARLLGATMEDISMFTDEVIGSGVQVNKVFEVPGVRRYLFVHGVRAVVYDNEVIAMKNYLESKLDVDEQTKIKIGKTIDIPFLNQSGKIVAIEGKKCIVRLQMLAATMQLQLN